MQLEMLDKTIAELRAVQVVNRNTGEPLNWALEFRFSGEDKWQPIKLEVYAIDVKEKENEDGSGSTATEENPAA